VDNESPNGGETHKRKKNSSRGEKVEELEANSESSRGILENEHIQERKKDWRDLKHASAWSDLSGRGVKN